MTQQAYASNIGSRTGQRHGWSGLVNSMIGFTNAATMFSIHQMQNSFAFLTDSRGMVDRFKRALDSLSEAMNREVDDSKRSTVEQMNRGGTRMVDVTVDTMTPRESRSRESTGSR